MYKIILYLKILWNKTSNLGVTIIQVEYFMKIVLTIRYFSHELSYDSGNIVEGISHSSNHEQMLLKEFFQNVLECLCCKITRSFFLWKLNIWTNKIFPICVFTRINSAETILLFMTRLGKYDTKRKTQLFLS